MAIILRSNPLPRSRLKPEFFHKLKLHIDSLVQVQIQMQVQVQIYDS